MFPFSLASRSFPRIPCWIISHFMFTVSFGDTVRLVTDFVPPIPRVTRAKRMFLLYPQDGPQTKCNTDHLKGVSKMDFSGLFSVLLKPCFSPRCCVSLMEFSIHFMLLSF